MDWRPLADDAWTNADTPSYRRAWHARAEAEWCGDQFQLQADGWPSCGAGPSRTTHNLHTTKISYRFHPFYGVEVEVVRYLRRTESAVLIVRLPGGAQVALPEWMLTPRICDRMTHEDKPRIAIDALLDLRRLIDAHQIRDPTQDRICAESASGGQDAQQQTDRAAARAALRGGRDMERTSGLDAGTLPNSVAPAVGKRSQDERTEAK